ncbi:MAG TPA: hypothetical protein VF542_06590 [Jatrophihabitans sp.]
MQGQQQGIVVGAAVNRGLAYQGAQNIVSASRVGTHREQGQQVIRNDVQTGKPIVVHGPPLERIRGLDPLNQCLPTPGNAVIVKHPCGPPSSVADTDDAPQSGSTICHPNSGMTDRSTVAMATSPQ